MDRPRQTGTLIESLKDPAGTCDVAYLIGVKKASECKYDEAMDWFQAELETGDTKTPLYNSTYAFVARYLD